MSIRNRYAFPYWRIVLFNLLHQEHRGYFDVGRLFEQQMKAAEEKYETCLALVEQVIDSEPGETKDKKEKVFFEKTELPDKFLIDLRKKVDTAPRTNSIMAIIMGHTCDEINNEMAEKLIRSVGISLETPKPLFQLYLLLLNIRDQKDFEKMVREEPGDNQNKKRISVANRILFDSYQIPKIKNLFAHRKGVGELKLPSELILGYYPR